MYGVELCDIVRLSLALFKIALLLITVILIFSRRGLTY
jgi:hypothetical protein